MKTVAFFISSYSDLNTGVGGHYRSVKEIANLLSADYDVRVFTFGNVPSPILSQLDCYEHIDAGNILLPQTWRTLRRVRDRLNSGDDEILYVTVGDLACYVPILFCMGLRSATMAHLKPGGPSFPRSYMFNGIPLMVFHKQDYALFAAHDEQRPLMMAPGRVSPPPYERDYLEAAVPELLEAENRQIRILTVCRIAEEKAKSLSVMYGALDKLKSDGNVLSVHIGIRQDGAVLDDLNRYAFDFEHRILTADHVVDTAARATHACDLFIGLGRSVMEAMALGKIAFVPVLDARGDARLMAVTRKNWTTFQNHNFTNRTPIADLEACGDPVYIEDVVGDFERWKTLGEESRAIFQDNLSVERSAAVWQEFYNRATRFRIARHRDFARFVYFVAMAVKRQLKPLKR